ncbi:MAG: ribosome small subunit-dependent GTPase A [Acidimicrobiia bacterium]
MHFDRVARVDRSLAVVLTGAGEVAARVPRGLHVVTGDEVTLAPEGDAWVVSAVAPRRSAITRADSDGARAPQVLAANVDFVFVVCGLDRPLRPGRIERAVVLAWECGAEPVLVLTKADLAADPEGAAAEAAGACPGSAVHVTSASTGLGLDGLAARLGGHRTAALMGESGAGKSTLINALVGDEVLATGAVRAGDAKGRHTTTARHLILLPGGGALIDTPGLRQLGLWSGEDGLAAAFADVESLAAQCRFRDCAHTGEPACAVAEAVTDGRLPARRLAGYVKLRRELDLQEGRVAEHERRAAGRRGSLMVRDALRAKGRRDR